jgi:EpsD family peptidyl-prolyl cis-trans isomerase
VKILRLLFGITLILLHYGCSSQSEKEVNGSVAAVVNGVEITKAEVESLARRSIASGSSKSEAIEQKKAILANLVRAELLAQKGRELGVDKDPEYSIALYEAQRQVLAGMAEARLVKDISPISANRAAELVTNNPRFFADRKLLVYDEILIQGVEVPFLNSLIAMVDNGASESKLLEELSSKKKVFQKTTKALGSDQIQPGILEVLLKAKLNQPIVARVGDKFSLIMTTHMVLPIPVQGEQANKTMMSMAYSYQRNSLLSKDMADMINASKITYFGEYALKNPNYTKTSILPTPNKKSEDQKTFKRIVLGAVMSISIILATLILTASMRMLLGELWLPRLWPSFNNKKDSETVYEWSYDAYLIEKIFIAIITMVVLGCLTFDIYFMSRFYPVIGIITSVVSGILFGIAISRVFSLELLKNASNKIYAVLIAVFTLPIIAGLLVILRQPAM